MSGRGNVGQRKLSQTSKNSTIKKLRQRGKTISLRDLVWIAFGWESFSSGEARWAVGSGQKALGGKKNRPRGGGKDAAYMGHTGAALQVFLSLFINGVFRSEKSNETEDAHKRIRL